MPVAAQNQPDWPEGATLLLGIGAQKAGTSWLHAYLRGHPACSTGPMKELHYFDSLKTEGRLGRRLHAEALEKAREKGAPAGRIKRLERLCAICEAPDPDHPEGDGDAAIWARFLERTGLTDVCAVVGCDDPGAIDKAAFRSDAGVTLEPQGHRFETDVFVRDDGADLSDHHALAVPFTWSAPALG